LGQPKEYLYLHPELKLKPAELARLKKFLARRKKGEPLAYILGYKYFHGLKFKVNRSVLIPRPETEGLVDLALKLAKNKKLNISKILDLGTGSGCIAIALAKQLHTLRLNSIQITASDISAKALDIALTNSQTLSENITLVQSDLFESLPGRYDIIIANLPYVPLGLYQILQHTLKFEPKIAITDNTNSWVIYARFFQDFSKHLKPQGTVYMEIDDDSMHELKALFRQHCPRFKDFKLLFLKDLSGRIRYLSIAPRT
jgi:release factor glutamine methyltransferase